MMLIVYLREDAYKSAGINITTDNIGYFYKVLGWLGYLFALIEIVVYEISNGVFLLHCFFIGIYNYLSDKARTKLKNLNKKS